MLKYWFDDLKTAWYITNRIPKRTIISLSITEIAQIDSGKVCVIETPEITIILTSEKSTIDTPKE